MIPFVKPYIHRSPFNSLDRAFNELTCSKQLTCGPYTEALENKVAGYVGSAHAVAVSSATAGLTLAARAWVEINHIDPEEVQAIVPLFTFGATVEALINAGVEHIKFVDVNERTGLIDASKVANTVASFNHDKPPLIVCPVDIFGQPYWGSHELKDAIANYESPILTLCDSAQSLGSYRADGRENSMRWDAQVYSLSPTKVITAGEGGVICTDDITLASLLRSMRDYGKTKRSTGEVCIDRLGMSARMSEFHALIGLNNMEHINEIVHERQALAAYYRYRVATAPLPLIPMACDSDTGFAGPYLSNAYVAPFTISKNSAFYKDAERLVKKLTDLNIEAKLSYRPADKHGICDRLINHNRVSKTDSAGWLWKNCILLPFYNEITRDEQVTVIHTLISTLGENDD